MKIGRQLWTAQKSAAAINCAGLALALTLAANVQANSGDIQRYQTDKEHRFIQTSAAPSVEDPATPWRFNAEIQATSGTTAGTSSVQNPTLTLPAATITPFPYDTSNIGWSLKQDFANKPALDAAFSNGSYTFTMPTVTAPATTFNATLGLTGDAYPNTPSLTNTSWSGGNLMINSTLSFNFTWNSFTGALPGAFINVDINGLPTQQLAATATSYTLPANSLPPGQMISFKLIFANPTSVDTTSVPGVTGLAGYGADDRLTIQTLQPNAIETNGGLDPLFNPGSITNGDVYAAILQPDGKLLIGGAFTKANGVTRQSVARLNPDGTLDTTFDPGAGPDFGISGMVLQPDGKLLIFGGFSTVNGVARDAAIARLNGDGSLDAAFNPSRAISFDGSFDGMGGTLNPGFVNSVVLQADGKIVVTGQFFFIITGVATNAARSGVARFNSDGTFDASYNPGTGLNNMADPTLTTGNYAVRQFNGKVILAGVFDQFNGNAVPGLVRLNTDGTYDNTFNPGTATTPDHVRGLFVQAGDDIIVFGDFTSFSGFARNCIVRLGAANGAVDAGFSTAAFKLFADPGSIAGVAQQADGKLLLGGFFHSLGADTTQGVVRLNTNGTRDGTFDTSVAAGIGFPECFAIRSADNKIFVGGNFSTYNGVNRNNITLVNPDGSLDTVFAPSGVADNFPEIRTVAVQSDGKVLAGGFFTSISGEPRDSLVRFNSDGSIDHTFGVTLGTYGSLSAILIQPDGKIMIGGQFRAIDSTPMSRVARLNPDGTIDPTFNPGNGPDSFVRAMAQDSAGNTYIVGDFLNVNGTPRAGLAKLTTSGSLDTTFNPGTGFNGSARAIAAPNGSAGPVIAGFFTTYNGATVNRIVRVDATTAAGDTAFTANNGTGFNGSVRALGLTPSGQYLAGGNFSSFNGTSRPRLLRLNGDGTLDPSFTPTVNGAVLSLAQQNGKIFAGGAFSSPTNRVARFLSSGATDATFNPGTGVDTSPPNAFAVNANRVTAMAVGPDGKLVIGGTFNLYNGTTRVCLARLTDSILNYAAVSRKVHGGATTFDIPLPLTGSSGVECRAGGATNDFRVVFTFGGAVTFSNASLTSGTGSVSAATGSGTNSIIVDLTGVTNAQRIAVTLAGVSDGASTADLGVPLAVLLGDTTGNGTVNASDVSLTKSFSGQAAAANNFRADVNASGSINGSDVGQVKSKVGTSLPP
ncbi:MAG: dockerin type I domain-containing protein [Chthoniobacterales bacterium]